MEEGATQHSPGPKRLGHHGQAAPSEGYYWQEAGGDRNAGSCKRTSENTCTRSPEDTRLSAPSGCSSVLSHVVTGFLPERCMPVTYGPPARCSLSLDKSDRRLAAILTCRSTAPTTTTKASRAATTHVPSRSFTRRPSLSSSSARSKTNVRVAQREGTKGRRR
jgi:hypothetical protein